MLTKNFGAVLLVCLLGFSGIVKGASLPGGFTELEDKPLFTPAIADEPEGTEALLSDAPAAHTAIPEPLYGAVFLGSMALVIVALRARQEARIGRR